MRRVLRPGGGVRGSISSCHMLWFLFLASKPRLSSGQLPRRGGRRDEQERRGRAVVSLVTLQPKVVYSGEKTAVGCGRRTAAPSGARSNVSSRIPSKTEVVVRS